MLALPMRPRQEANPAVRTLATLADLAQRRRTDRADPRGTWTDTRADGSRRQKDATERVDASKT
jgi:hypothetical protein